MTRAPVTTTSGSLVAWPNVIGWAAAKNTVMIRYFKGLQFGENDFRDRRSEAKPNLAGEGKLTARRKLPTQSPNPAPSDFRIAPSRRSKAPWLFP